MEEEEDMIEIIPIEKIRNEVSKQYSMPFLYGLGLMAIGKAALQLFDEYTKSPMFKNKKR